MKKVLVTGGAGFVGRHLSRKLIEIGCEVNILDDLSSSRSTNIDPESRFFQGDIRDSGLVQKAMKDCDTVFHLAARVELQKSLIDPVDCFSSNISGTAGIVQECLKNPDRRLVLASSSAVYPLHPLRALTEDDAILGETPYALSKRAGEQSLEIYREFRGLSSCALRCFNIYGPGQRLDSAYSAVIPKFISLALKGIDLEIHGKGNQTRDFIHVSDVVHCYILAGQSNVTGAFNVGTGQAISVLDLARIVVGIEGRVRYDFGPEIPGNASSSNADISKTRAKLKFESSTSLRDGIESTYSWYAKKIISGRQPAFGIADKER